MVVTMNITIYQDMTMCLSGRCALVSQRNLLPPSFTLTTRQEVHVKLW